MNKSFIALAFIALQVGVIASAADTLTSTVEATVTEVAIRFRGVQSNEGFVLISVFNDAKAFPNHPDQAVYKIKIPAVRGETAAIIEGVPSGEYAVAIVHDENGNNKMDKNGLGLPKEDFGFSNDAMGSFGPPSFKKAKVTVRGAVTDIVVSAKHF